jgi:DNA polymerase III subunit beta
MTTTATFKAADTQRALRTLSAFTTMRHSPTVTLSASVDVMLTTGSHHDVLASVHVADATLAGRPFSVSRSWLARTLRTIAPGKNDEATLEVTDEGTVTVKANGWTVQGKTEHDKLGAPSDDKRDPQHETTAFNGQTWDPVTISADDIKRAARHVATAASKDENLPILATVHCRVASNIVTMTATDRYRLHRASVPAPGTDDLRSWLIPAKILKAAANHATTGGVTFTTGGEQGTPDRIVAGDLAVCYVPETMKFPDVGKIIDQAIEAGQDRHATFDTRELASAVRTAEALSTGQHAYRQAVKITVQGEAAMLSNADELFSMASPDLPTTLHGLDAEGYVVALNPHYLQEAVTALPTGGTTRIGFNHTPYKPVHIHDPELPGHDAVLMPVRVPTPMGN